MLQYGDVVTHIRTKRVGTVMKVGARPARDGQPQPYVRVTWHETTATARYISTWVRADSVTKQN